MIFWADWGIKRQKAFQNDKKFCLLHSISQGPYKIWLSFMVQMCKMVISSGVFFSFKILIFWFVRGLKRLKVNQNDKGFCLSHLVFQNHISYDLDLWYTCMYKRIISPGIFLFFIFFQNFNFRDKRAKNEGKLPISVFYALYLRNCRFRSYHWDFVNDIYRCFSLFFFTKIQHCKY